MTEVSLIERCIKPEILALEPYVVPSAQGMIKLDAMENPFQWPGELYQEWVKSLAAVSLNRYPDARAKVLEERLCAVYDLPQACEVLFGNGSDELIQMILMALAGSEPVVMALSPSFVMYAMIAQVVGCRYEPLALDADFQLSSTEAEQCIKRTQPAVIFVAQPNNPTGTVLDPNVIETILRVAPGLVVLDEAYCAFTEVDYTPWLKCYENLLVMRTFSKIGLAGVRLGYLLGAKVWLDQLNKIRLPYNINTLTQCSVSFALDHSDVLERQSQLIQAQRVYLQQQLSELPGLKQWPSQANFILFRVTVKAADRVHAQLKAQGVLIKCLHGSHPALAQCLRVTVGSAEENTRFLTALKKLLIS